MKKLFLAALLAMSGGIAQAGTLNGPMISRIVDDKAFYQPGDHATITIEMVNNTGSDFNGKLNISTCSRGQQLAIDAHNVFVGKGTSQTNQFGITVPSLAATGYQLAINALNASDNGSSSCTGTGSTSSNPVDVASGALNIASKAQDDPIEAFVDPQAMQSVTDYDAVAHNLAQYHVNIIQFYDWGYRHDAPYTSQSSWRNLQNVPVTQAETAGLINAFHKYGIDAQLYVSWNGAYSDWMTKNPNLTLGMAAFKDQCGLSGSCSSSDQITTASGWSAWGWATDGSVQENPANGRWQQWITSQYEAAINGWGFDAVHLDTMGDPGMQAYDIKGRPINNFGTYLADFANYVQATTGKCTDINQVSSWNLQGEAVRGHSCNLYIEPHPEFGNVPYFSSFNGMMEQMHEWTARPLITAFYPQQVMSGSLGSNYALSGDTVPYCDPSSKGSSACLANNPGIELLMGQVATSGASQLMLGDVDHLTPGPFFPRASLGMDSNLQQFMADYYNWFVAFRDLLRGHSTDTDDIVTLTDSNGNNIGSSNGDAGKIYYHPWERAGVAEGVSLTNLVGLSDNRIDDPDGMHKPVEQKNVQITTQVYGGSPTGSAWYAAPDYNHGFPQKLNYTVGTSGAWNGNPIATVTLTIPDLKTSGIIWIEGRTLKNQTDWTLDATASDLIRGGTPTWSPNGMGARVAASVHGCCGRAIYWDNIDFGQNGVTSLSSITYSPYGGVMEFHIDQQDGPLLGKLALPRSSDGNLDNLSAPVDHSPTGIHRIWAVFPGREVSLYGWKP